MTELLIKKEMAADQLANSAAKRSSPIARKVLAYMVVGTFVCGLLAVAFSDIPVSLIAESNPKSILWGLIKWGGDMKVVVAEGFVLPPWAGWSETDDRAPTALNAVNCSSIGGARR